MYKLIENKVTGEIQAVNKVDTGVFIPFDPANADYQQFKVNVLAGETLERPDGTPMTQAEADAYIATLP